MVEAVKSGAAKGDTRAAAGRDRLLLVAMKLFAAHGFDGVTVRDISSAANVSVGLINHHFRSKEGLRQAVDDYFISRTAAAIERAIESTQNLAPDLIADFQRNWIVKYKDEWPEFVAYFRRAIVEASPWGETLFRRYHESIRRMVDRLDAAGKIRPETDRFWLPLIYMFVLLGPLVLDPFIRNMFGRSAYEPEMWARFSKAFNQILWEGIGSR
jgi:AcrR family transcriptional regulator